METTTAANFMTSLPVLDYNLTNSTREVRNLDLARIEIIVQAVILVLAVFGNGTVLVVLFLKKTKLSRMNLMIVHLSLADLFVAFFNVLPQLLWDVTGTFQGGDVLCRMVKYFQLVAMYASSFVLVSTAIDRWMAICHPLTAHTWGHRKLHSMVAVAWILSLLFSLPQIAIFSYKLRNDGVYDCWAMFNPDWTLQFYITLITLLIYVIPLILLVVTYGSISYVVWKSTRGKEKLGVRHTTQNSTVSSRQQLLNQNRNEHQWRGEGMHPSPARIRTGDDNPRAHVRGGMTRAKMKTIKLTVTVIICYVVCWGPFFLFQMWGAWDPNAPFQGVAFVIVLLLASLNSCTNPWIYLAFSGVICAAVKKSNFRQPKQPYQHALYSTTGHPSTARTRNGNRLSDSTNVTAATVMG